jgi:hypothetical protein
VDLRVLPVHELAVHPDLLDLGDRHLGVLLSAVASAPTGVPTG